MPIRCFKLAIKKLLLGYCLALTSGCVAEPINTFTFTADLPPDFAYVAAVYYVPEKGETCTAKKADNKAPVFNREWRTEYKREALITIRRTRDGCPLVVNRIRLEINAAYGKGWSDIGADFAGILIRDKLDDAYIQTLNEADESDFYGQCQWRFRTSGKPRILRKILNCTSTDAKGKPVFSQPFAAYTLDQLPGKTVRMNIKLADEERPAIGDTWVKVPNGWKRCMGDNFDDQYAFCYGNYKDFSGYQTHDGKQCTIYPGCTE